MDGTPAIVSPRPASSSEPAGTYVRKNLLRAAIALIVLVGAVGAASVLYEAELYATMQWIERTVGVGGLMAVLFLSDSVITPIPPDLILVVIAKSELSSHWLPLLGLMGLVSVAAGNVAYFLGARLGDRGWLQRVFGGLRDKHRVAVTRYGRWGVALGAVTPIPFSVTCWTAGVLEMRPADVFWPTLLRLPRFFFYYAMIVSGDSLLRWIFG